MYIVSTFTNMKSIRVDTVIMLTATAVLKKKEKENADTL